MSKRLLFIHHGSVAGGAPLSMLYTMQGMREAGYEPMAALVRPSPELHALYNDNGFLTIETPWIPIFITWSGSEGKRYNPIMWKGVYDAWRAWRNAHNKLQELLQELKIDIVHLNSVALSNPATLLMKINKPFIWHVREHGPVHQGRRFHFLRKKLLAAPEVIFLSRAERRSWMGGNDNGTVVHNFVDFTKFDRSVSGGPLKEKLAIPSDHKVILFVGGKKKHKGIYELLEALKAVKEQYGDNFTCLMPDSEIDDTNLGTVGKKMLSLLKKYNLEVHCRLLPFDPNIVDMFAACDLLVFPATKPHFARPVVEASAMGKPVIASDLKAIDELVLDGKTGFLVDHRDPSALAGKIILLFTDQELSRRMGEAGVVFAHEHFGYENQMKKIEAVYERLTLA